MFKYKNSDLKLVFIPACILFGLALLGFIVSSFWDVEIAEFFAKGMKYKSVKVWIIIYDELGVTQSIPVVFLIVGVFGETIHFYAKTKKGKNILQSSFLLWVFYVLFIVFWSYDQINKVIYAPIGDSGFGVGFDPKLVESNNWKFITRLILYIIELLIIFYIIYFLRFKFSKRTDIMSQEYWVDAIKALFCFFMTGITVFTVKWSMGRPFYYNTIFETIYANEILPLGWVQYGPSDPNFVAWGVGVNGNQNATYLEWWEPNDFFGNLKYWFSSSGIRDTNSNVWWNKAFPSGHTISTFTLINTMYFFVGSNKGRKMTNWKIAVFVIWIVHLNSMQFSLIVFRFHWLSDTTFSILMGLFWFLIVNRVANLAIYRTRGTIVSKYMGTKSEVLLVNQNGKCEMYFVSNNYNHYYKTIKEDKKEKNKQKLAKCFTIIEKNP